MYFDLEDYRPDVAPVGRAISWREGVLLSIITHLAMIIIVLVAPRFLPDNSAARARAIALAEQRAEQQDKTTFVFVQPKQDIKAPKPPDRGEASDQDRIARAPERAPNPINQMPFARGNSPEKVEEPPPSKPRGEGPAPDPAAGQQARNDQQTEAPTPVPDSSKLKFNAPDQASRNGANGRGESPGGLLGDALRNLQRYTQTFENSQGGGGQFGDLQFDTKGVEFGPWVRRFVAQVKRNWLIPYSAYSMSGHVVITFNIHKDGTITDLSVVGPSAIDSFNNSAFGALSASNPTQPLPPEYPADKAFFTITFFYNETPR